MHQSVNRYNLITLPQYRWAKYCKQRVCMSACLSLSAHVSPKPHVKISPNFLYIHVSLFNHTSQNRATRDFGSIWAVGLPICTPVRLPSLACTACHLCLPCATVRPSKPRPWSHIFTILLLYIDTCYYSKLQVLLRVTKKQCTFATVHTVMFLPRDAKLAWYMTQPCD